MSVTLLLSLLNRHSSTSLFSLSLCPVFVFLLISSLTRTSCLYCVKYVNDVIAFLLCGVCQ